MKTTGSSSRMALLSSPLASAGVAGVTTLSPGTWANIASRFCEWVEAGWGPPPRPLPAEHVHDLGGVVDNLVGGEKGEIDRHQLGHRPEAPHGGADGRPGNDALGDGRGKDPLPPQIL